MEALLVIGGGVALANHFAPKHGVQTKADDMGAAYALKINEAREHGLIAPSFNSLNYRAPWTTISPSYGTLPQITGDCTDAPTERLYRILADSEEVHRRKIEEQLVHEQPTYALRRGQPLVTAFNHELHNPETGRSTEFQNYSWVPPNPDDGDYHRAGVLAKQIPRDPMLFTPDAHYFTAPGLSWRYAPM